MKNRMSLATSKCFAYVANGVGWLIFGVLSMFDNEICSVCASVILVICVIMSITSRRFTNEVEDEMSEYNLMKAQATTMYWLKTIICVILLLFALMKLFNFDGINYKANLTFVIPMVFATTEILTGILFVKYEKDGE